MALRQTPEHLTRKFKKGYSQREVGEAIKMRIEEIKQDEDLTPFQKGNAIKHMPKPRRIFLDLGIHEGTELGNIESGLELTLKGGFQGLWGEIVEEDIYRLRNLYDGSRAKNTHDKAFNFTPDVILDLGANIGVFSRYARILFPDVPIIAVEPNPSNINIFKKYTHDNNLTLIECGIGKGQLYRSRKPANGSGECYLSKNSIFNESELKRLCAPSGTGSIMLTDLKIKKEDKVLCKIDIEGNETTIFEDSASIKMLLSFDYVTMELHFFTPKDSAIGKVKKDFNNIMNRFKKTHTVKYEHPMFYATKK